MAARDGANADFASAEQQFARGDFAQAYDSYAKLLSAALARNVHANAALANATDVVIAERLAQLAVLFGDHDAAEQLLEGVAAVARDAGNPYLSDYMTLQRLHLAVAAPRPAAAKRLLEELAHEIGDLIHFDACAQALAHWEFSYGWHTRPAAQRLPLLISLYLAMGEVSAMHGWYGRACTYFARGCALCTPPAPDLALRMRPALELGWAAALLEQGDIAGARARLTLSETDADPPGPAPVTTLRRQELRAKAALLAGDYGLALQVLDQVVARSGQLGLHRACLLAQLNQAQVLIIVNQTLDASRLLAFVHSTATALGDQPLALQAGVLANLARLRGQSLAPATLPAQQETWGDGMAGAAPNKFAPDALPQDRSFLAWFETRALAVHWHIGHGKTEAAQRALQHLSATFGHTDSSLVQGRIEMLRGMVAYYLGQWQQAAVALDAARQVAIAHGAHGELWQILRLLGWTHQRLGAPAAQLADIAAQADHLLDQHSASLGGAQRAMFLLNKWTAGEERLALAMQALARDKQSSAQRRWPAAQWLRWRMRTAVRTLLADTDHHKSLIAVQNAAPSASAARSSPSTLNRLHDGLVGGWRCATISFLVLPDRTLVVCACGGKLDFCILPVTRLYLRELVGEWHRCRTAEGDGQGHAMDFGAELSRILALTSILETLPARVTSLRIVPDDILHGVPFALLRYNGRYLVEQYALSTDCKSEPDAWRPHRIHKFMLAGVSRPGGHYGPLPHVGAELAGVSTILRMAGCDPPTMDDGVSRAWLAQQLTHCSAAHIACHGVFIPDQPDQSGLILMPQPGRQEILTVRDAAQLDLHGLQHITLSSCWAAQSYVMPGRWIIALPETLLRAGAGSVLASLWAVHDRAGAALMTEFYRHVTRMRRDRALQLAQLACMQSSDPAIASPWNWAGFALYGNARRLHFRSAIT